MFLIEFLFPLSFRVLTIFAIVAAFVASGAVASLDVIIKLALEFGSNFLAVNDGIQVRSFESFGEFSGLFVVGSAG